MNTDQPNTELSGSITVGLLTPNNDGYSKEIRVGDGTSIADALAGNQISLNGMIVRVNQQSVTESYRLRDGDRVELVPTELKGS